MALAINKWRRCVEKLLEFCENFCFGQIYGVTTGEGGLFIEMRPKEGYEFCNYSSNQPSNMGSRVMEHESLET